MTYTDYNGGSDPPEWEPLQILNPGGDSVSVIEVINELIIALYLQPIYLAQFNFVRPNQAKDSFSLYYSIYHFI